MQQLHSKHTIMQAAHAAVEPRSIHRAVLCRDSMRQPVTALRKPQTLQECGGLPFHTGPQRDEVLNTQVLTGSLAHCVALSLPQTKISHAHSLILSHSLTLFTVSHSYTVTPSLTHSLSLLSRCLTVSLPHTLQLHLLYGHRHGSWAGR